MEKNQITLDDVEVSPMNFLSALEKNDLKLCDYLFKKLEKILDINEFPFVYMVCKKGNLKYLKLFFDKFGSKIDINRGIGKKILKKTALLIAIKRKRDDCVEKLLQFPKIDVNKGSFVEGTDEKKSTLYYACVHNLVDSVKKLVRHKDIDVNQGYSRSPLENFKRIGSVEYKETETPLCVASRRGYANIVKILLGKRDIDVNKGFVTRKGHVKTSLYMATERNMLQVVKLLLRSPKIDVNYSNKKTPLMIACEMNHLEIVKELISSEKVNFDIEHNNRNCFHIACERGFVLIVKELLKCKQIKVNLGYEGLGSGLHFAVSNNKLGVVRELVKNRRVDVNERNIFKDSPLHLAVEKNFKYIVACLLLSNNDIDISAKNLNGKTAFDLADKSCKKMLRFYKTNKVKFRGRYWKKIRQLVEEEKTFGSYIICELPKIEDDYDSSIISFESDLRDLKNIRLEIEREKRDYLEMRELQNKMINELKRLKVEIEENEKLYEKKRKKY